MTSAFEEIDNFHSDLWLATGLWKLMDLEWGTIIPAKTHNGRWHNMTAFAVNHAPLSEFAIENSE